ncbi:MAG: hypothetical protein JWR50_130 [Mucilaginibacter sp.]|nr:hypothetical protein [Mucilaginibacter sp.]
MKIMNSTGLIASLLITTLSFTACGQVTKSTENTTRTSAGKGFAVLELFTSEGCSSCPPADELLAQIQRESNGKPVYILAYHVDYWNRLGWKDVFSKAEFSKRQQQYSNWLNAQIYTPQLVINGTNELVGSDKSAIYNAIAGELTGATIDQLVLDVHKEGEHLKVHFKIQNTPKDSRLLIALIQRDAQTKVARGENAGHTLSHVQIVHQLQTVPLDTVGEGNIIIALQAGFDAQNWEVLAMIQDQNNGAITAAAKAELSNVVIAKRIKH